METSFSKVLENLEIALENAKSQTEIALAKINEVKAEGKNASLVDVNMKIVDEVVRRLTSGS